MNAIERDCPHQRRDYSKNLILNDLWIDRHVEERKTIKLINQIYFYCSSLTSRGETQVLSKEVKYSHLDIQAQVF